MEQLLDYLRMDMAFEREEHVRVLFLDAGCSLLRDEAMWSGTVDAAPFYPREIVRRALDLGAAALIVVHNHPSGDPTPTRADVDRTLELEQAAGALGIGLHDHLVIAERGHSSMRADGLLTGA